MDDYKKIDTFSNRLKSLLDAKNLKQSDLAKLTNLSKQQISQYVNGKFEPRPVAVLNIAKVLDINELWLMGYDVPMNGREMLSTDSQFEQVLLRVLSLYKDILKSSQLLEETYKDIKESSKDIEETYKDIKESSKDIEKIYGEKAVDLLKYFSKLNSIGREKILELINDLMQIDKYVIRD